MGSNRPHNLLGMLQCPFSRLAAIKYVRITAREPVRISRWNIVQVQFQGRGFQYTYRRHLLSDQTNHFHNGVGEEGRSSFAQGVEERLEGFFRALLTKEACRIEEFSIDIPAGCPKVMSGLKKPPTSF